MQQNQKKWESKASTRLQKTTPDQIWPLFQDFFGLGQWFPGLAICHGIHGTNGEPGCIRYCEGFRLQRENNDTDEVMWSKEKLVDMDKNGMRFSYEIVDSNIGFESYVSTIEVFPGGDGGGAVVEWGISVDPVEGWELDELVKKYEVGLMVMVRNMEDHICNS